ncbi:MAG: RNA methyltransferase [Saprospiraceae bacterium]
MSERLERLKKVVQRRQLNLTVILENVHDTHNIGAVLRSCDAVGIQEVFVLYTEPIKRQNSIILGKKTSGGTRKWLDVHLYTNLEDCMQHVKSKYQTIYSTHLSSDSKNIYDIDLTQSIAILFGNEKDGISHQALQYADANISIPQMGVTQSLNISVACAITLYESFRQRAQANMYENNTTMTNKQCEALWQQYFERNELAHKGKMVIKSQ